MLARSKVFATSLLGLVLAGGAAVTLAPAQAGTTGVISGTVTAEVGGAALPGIEVSVYGWSDSQMDLFELARMTTSATGTYSFTGLDDGEQSYYVGFRDPAGDYAAEYWLDQNSPYDANQIYIDTEGPERVADAALAPAGTVTGTVSGEDAGALSGIAVTVFQETPGPLGLGGLTPFETASTNGSGVFEVDGLPADDYVIEYYDPAGEWLTEGNGNVPNYGDSPPITVGSGETVAGQDATLSPAGHITGRVTNGSTPLAGIRVAALVDEGDDYWVSTGVDVTDASGLYDVGGLPTGSYKVTFYDEANVYVREYWNNVATEEAATPLSVVAGDDSELPDVVLAPRVSPSPTSTASPTTTATPTPTTTASPTVTPTTTPPTVTPTTLPAPAPPAPTTAQPTSITFPSGMKVAGSLKVGSTLKLKNYQAILGRAATTYSFQWYAGTKAIKKATKPKLKLTASVRGKKISVKVTARSGSLSKSKKLKLGKVK